LNCIIALYCVIAYTPQSTVRTGFTHLLTHMTACVFVFLLQEGRLTLYYNLLLPYCLLILTLVICLLPQLLRAVAPALTLIMSCQLRPTFCLLWWTLLFYWLLVACWLWCSLCCSVPYFYFRFSNYSPIHYFICNL